jgi:hypothetical protein
VEKSASRELEGVSLPLAATDGSALIAVVESIAPPPGRRNRVPFNRTAHAETTRQFSPGGNRWQVTDGSSSSSLNLPIIFEHGMIH